MCWQIEINFNPRLHGLSLKAAHAEVNKIINKKEG